MHDIWLFAICVPTFGNLRINAHLQLPTAYRSLSRPSSAPDAKAFTLRSYSLVLPFLFLDFGSLELLDFLYTFGFAYRIKKVFLLYAF